MDYNNYNNVWIGNAIKFFSYMDELFTRSTFPMLILCPVSFICRSIQHNSIFFIGIPS